MPLELKITMADDGSNISVTGPIDNVGVCYGMLELAKDSIREHQARKRNETRIRPATMSDLAVAGIGKKGDR